MCSQEHVSGYEGQSHFSALAPTNGSRENVRVPCILRAAIRTLLSG